MLLAIRRQHAERGTLLALRLHHLCLQVLQRMLGEQYM